MLYPYPSEVSKEKFLKNNQNNNALYGLPNQIKFCKSCVISNQRPSSSIEFKHNSKELKKSIGFSHDDICDACKVKDQKKSINWAEREEQLRELCNKFRSKDNHYDCIVPGSGGKDSFMTAHLLKYKFGMNPLTVTWAPHIYTDWGWRNHQAWIHAGFDNILFTPNGKVHRLITRLAVENILHPFQPFILGQKNLAPKIASLYNIPLIFYGENEAEYGNPRMDNSKSKQSWEYFTAASDSDIYLGGASLDQLKELGLSKSDWQTYLPTNPQIIEDKKIEVHYISYYVKWHPQGAYYYAVDNSDFKCSPERSAGTYSTYSSIDDRVDDFHYHTTWIKFGIGRATYDASQEIRSGDITREEGVALVKKFDGEFPERWANEVFKYLSINKDDFPIASKAFENPIFDKQYYDLLCENFRSPHLWCWDEQDKWQLRKTVFSEVSETNYENEIMSWKGNLSK